MEAKERFMATLAALDERMHRLRTCLVQVHHLVSLCLSLLSANVESVVARHPWVRNARNALFHVLAFIVGSTHADELVAFSKPRLVKNDAYRDRLLEPEIADLVDLSDALQLTVPQRKAVFQCFLHVDFMRRAGITRSELLRYCNLRLTPLTCFMLPESVNGATHRGGSGATKRWDIMQWIAVCFTVCTLDLSTTVGMNELLLSYTDIITVARIQLNRKHEQQERKKKDADRRTFKVPLLSIRHGGRNSDGDSALPDLPSSATKVPTQNSEARMSTPRKILPSIGISSPLETFASKTAMTRTLARLDTPELNYTSETVAWKVIANHVLASVYLGILFRDDSDLHIFEGKLAPETCEALRKTLVREYGYQFAKFLFEKSSLKELSAASKSGLEEHRAQLRYKNAWKSVDPPEDKSRFRKHMSWLQLLWCVKDKKLIHIVWLPLVCRPCEQARVLLQHSHGRVAMGATGHLRRANKERQEKEAEAESAMTHKPSPFHDPDAKIETSMRFQ
ncbi:hypothetical protein FI667_g184, partial [Globisporangium splendens]